MSSETVEIAVYLAPTSQYMRQPGALSTVHRSLGYKGQVGELYDVHIVQVARADWDGSQREILDALMSAPGVVRVEPQQRKQRSKRTKDEL